ncbi:hypothetical protein B0T25DRAFT_609867 [Lasiosphaeria hispida]|uniref:Uncharacterized protein n=1 Tax=Lasiosphaeria hispida TaxID=260671 RepID=A0AAJ0MC42_9PEZI|nr:hypothetical protein B0T25DRAFT_609867 [Lasiosphaeria hispida]
MPPLRNLLDKERWFYPAELANDLRDVPLLPGFAAEAIACGWEYLLWQLDVAWVASLPHHCIVDFIRAFGRPIHLMMRRHRYVEDGLALENPETDVIIAQAERNVKLWSRMGRAKTRAEEGSRIGKERFGEVMSRQDS